jgi:ABC-type transport system involved in multi-copper enzyme maturation permease subunit
MIDRTLILVGHSLRRVRAMVVATGLLLAAFQFLLTRVAAYFLSRGAFGQLTSLLPDFVRNAAGPSALALMSYKGIVAFGYFHPVVIATLVGLMIAVATEPAAEVETRFVDLTLARPLTRASLIARSLVVLLVTAAVLLGLMLVGTALGLVFGAPAGAPRLPFALFFSLALSLGAVMICWAGVALAWAAGVRRRATAGAAVGGLALAAYLLDYLGRAWEPARSISVLSPFHYFDPNALVTGQAINTRNIVVLVLIGVIGSATSLAIFSRRDI